jgi:biotin/methionine sulfoxide reductase
MGDPTSRVTTSHWGAFRVTTEGNRITAVAPFERDPNPSTISRVVPAAVHHHSRIRCPAIRRGWLEHGPGKPGLTGARRGEDDFVEVPWDEALDIAAAEIQRIRETHGNESIFGGSYGWASAGRFHHALGQVHRFLNCAGGYVASVASYSTAAAQAIVPHVFGMPFLKLLWGCQNSWPMIADHSRLLVMFGGINPKNSQVSMGGVTHHETRSWFDQFANRGIRRVNVSPQRTDAPAGCEWMPVVPGSDTALMLALAHVLESGGMADQAFLASHTTGYERFRAYLLGETDGIPKTPEWAQPLCGVDADRIRSLARDMAQQRTLITVSWSLQRGDNGEQPYWMAAVLAAMLGQIGLPGGGIGYGYGAIGGVGVQVKRLPGLTFPQKENPVTTAIPVARIADMLLHPGEPFDFNGRSLEYPDIRLVYWCGGNPFHHHQDLNRLHRAWQRPETVIVHEPWWTATAKRADIVFPATTSWEREDIGRAQGDSYLFHMPKLIDPVGEARDDYDIFRDLAHRMGFGTDFSEGRDSTAWQAHLYDRFREDSRNAGIEIPCLEELRAANWVDLPVRGIGDQEPPFAAFRANPDNAPLDTPSGRIEVFSETIAGFGYHDCPGHPIWIAPREWRGSAQRYPLHMVSPQPGDKLHSQLECAIADLPGERPAAVVIHPDDAGPRGLVSGALVKIYNARGACRARAVVQKDVMPGVVALPTGAWFDPDGQGLDRQGNPNVLTRDAGTSRIGQGSSAHSCLVDIVALGQGD